MAPLRTGVNVTDKEEIEDIDATGVAQYLADLSLDGRLPQGVEHPKSLVPFQADDVNFETNDWISRTLTVQAWLRLESPIPLNLPAVEAAGMLFATISPDPPESCFVVSEETSVALTALGVQHLETWLSRATANREAFLEALEDDRPLREASDDWNLLWIEAGVNRARQPKAIQARVDTTTIRSFADYANDGVLDLNPSYQRDTVWSNGDSQLLIDSILRGIPIPSIILTEVGADRTYQIVDGKQRLTAILRFVGQHPVARKFAIDNDVESLLDQDPKKLMRKLHLKGKDISENYLPFRLAIYTEEGDPLRKLSGKYLAEIREEEIEVGHGKVKVGEIFAKANSKYKIPTIIYEQTRLQDIHHVFSIYNKQGKKLNAEELRNATYHHLGLTKLLLLLSGDRPYIEDLAPYLSSESRQDISEVGETLKASSFGTMRFKRTKVLSWACALFLHSPNFTKDSYSTPSTATHIDALLEKITQEQGSHLLYQNVSLVSLAKDIKKSVGLHAEYDDAWSPRFRSKKGYASRWEELPFVASLLTMLILVATGNDELLRDKIGDIRDLTEASPGPAKTQNKTQWEYIAKIVISILSKLKVDEKAATAILNKKYGISCLDYLRPISLNAGA